MGMPCSVASILRRGPRGAGFKFPLLGEPRYLCVGLGKPFLVELDARDVIVCLRLQADDLALCLLSFHLSAPRLSQAGPPVSLAPLGSGAAGPSRTAGPSPRLSGPSAAALERRVSRQVPCGSASVRRKGPEYRGQNL